jgi:hypothetical protein
MTTWCPRRHSTFAYDRQARYVATLLSLIHGSTPSRIGWPCAHRYVGIYYNFRAQIRSSIERI